MRPLAGRSAAEGRQVSDLEKNLFIT